MEKGAKLLEMSRRGLRWRQSAYCKPYRSAYPERVEEVVEAPGNNYVVVKRDEKCDYTGRDPYAA